MEFKNGSEFAAMAWAAKAVVAAMVMLQGTHGVVGVYGSAELTELSAVVAAANHVHTVPAAAAAV